MTQAAGEKCLQADEQERAGPVGLSPLRATLFFITFCITPCAICKRDSRDKIYPHA